MRNTRVFLSVALASVVAPVVLLAQTGNAGKVDVQWKCAAPNPVHGVPVADAPDHVYIVQQVKCTAARGGEIAGIGSKEGTATEFVEGTGANAKGHGIFVETRANGDTVVYSYTLQGVSKNKMMVSASNKWSSTSATGKFKGISSSGTCTGKGAADGSLTLDCTGTYTMK